ncbi:unnamed protein product [Vitrella brassicaformis CCMP3155]|uniref:WLM domain-containing protein n=2 Tax=Vitrella brassicaformis TaxID=1169539 RepID=A0A0G4GA71_VITBC|nr:unnamed protein product [Vitrella brassicaformis CCMP3155]|eukprot:CEM25778.1 unnamed protein product [Vitrella brassicaformis CCMP3155]
MRRRQARPAPASPVSDVEAPTAIPTPPTPDEPQPNKRRRRRSHSAFAQLLQRALFATAVLVLARTCDAEDQRTIGDSDPGGGAWRELSESCDPYVVREIKTEGYRNDRKAMQMLRDATNLVRPIMCNRQWSVYLMREFKPSKKSLLGLNVNQGEEVKVRVRFNNDDFVPYEQVIGTVLHELVHNSVRGHNSSFWDTYEDVVKECEKLRGGKPCENGCLITDNDDNTIEEIWNRMRRCPEGFFTVPVIIGIVGTGTFLILTMAACCWHARRRRMKRRVEAQKLKEAVAKAEAAETDLEAQPGALEALEEESPRRRRSQLPAFQV